MAVRTTAEQMAAVIELDDTIDVTPFIGFANELVTELCTNNGYSDERLAQIETLLACHAYTIRDPRTTSESVSGVSESKQMFTGPFLQSSEYGQMAMLLDTAGNLNRLNQRGIDGKGKQKAIIATLITDAERECYARDGLG